MASKCARKMLQYPGRHRRRIELEDKAKGRPFCLGDRNLAALAVLPYKQLNSAGLFGTNG